MLVHQNMKVQNEKMERARGVAKSEGGKSFNPTVSLGPGMSNVDECVATTDGEYVYIIAFDDEKYKFYKIDVDGQKTEVVIDGKEYIEESRFSISDGGDDKFDDGNIMGTNLTPEIPYTNNRNSSGSTGVSSLNYFGSGSTYATNLYSQKLFAMVATGTDITRFSISGGLGADGTGNMESGRFVITHGGHDYTAYYKNVFGTSDPSVNHVFVVPGNVNLTHVPSSNTDEDSDVLNGLNGINRIAYFLFSTPDGDGSNPVSQSDLENCVTTFVSTTNFFTSSLSSILTALESGGASSMLYVLPNVYTIIDDSNTDASGGLDSVKAICYVGDDRLFILYDDKLHIMTRTGAYLGGQQSAGYGSLDSIIYYNGEVYGFGYGNSLYMFDKETGAIIGDGSDAKKSNTLSWTDDNQFFDTIWYMVCPYVYGGKLYAVADINSQGYWVCEVNVETSRITAVARAETIQENDLNGFIPHILTTKRNTDIGMSTMHIPEDIDNLFYSNTFFLRSQQCYAQPTPQNIKLQYSEDMIANGSNAVWTDLPITQTEFNENNNEWFIDYEVPDGADNIDGLRLNYVDGTNGMWLYAEED